MKEKNEFTTHIQLNVAGATDPRPPPICPERQPHFCSPVCQALWADGGRGSELSRTQRTHGPPRCALAMFDGTDRALTSCWPGEMVAVRQFRVAHVAA